MISFKNVSKTYPNGTQALRGLSLDIPDNETLVLLGTSGSGKTTALKMINRLIDSTEGDIFIDDKSIKNMDAIDLRLNIGYAIQDVGLFPHMTVGENIAIVPRLLKWERDRVESRVGDLLNLVGLDPSSYKESYPDMLSGGQRQRVGVARSLAADPPVILMDEPFGALDPITREQLQDEFIELISGMNKTVVFVTHDVFEAVKMGDRIAIIDEGTLQQIDSPFNIVERPSNDFVRQFLGRHRFQLSLFTHRIKYYFDNLDESKGNPAEKPDTFLNGHESLAHALDLFKSTELKEIPVYEKDEYRGMLGVDFLTETISGMFNREGDSE